MARGVIEDPLKVFRFAVAESGLKRAGFSEVTGLEGSVEVAEYREGGYNETVRKSAGLASYANITLRRGQIIGSAEGGDDDLYTWWSSVQNVTGRGNAANYRRDLDIIQYDATYQEVRRWHVREAWPVRFKPMADLNATETAGNSIEEVELAHEGFTL
jgi:phage tail-like protein